MDAVKSFHALVLSQKQFFDDLYEYEGWCEDVSTSKTPKRIGRLVGESQRRGWTRQDSNRRNFDARFHLSLPSIHCPQVKVIQPKHMTTRITRFLSWIPFETRVIESANQAIAMCEHQSVLPSYISDMQLSHLAWLKTHYDSTIENALLTKWEVAESRLQMAIQFIGEGTIKLTPKTSGKTDDFESLIKQISNIDDDNPFPPHFVIQRPELISWLIGENPSYAPTVFELNYVLPAYIERKRKLRERALLSIPTNLQEFDNPTGITLRDIFLAMDVPEEDISDSVIRFSKSKTITSSPIGKGEHNSNMYQLFEILRDFDKYSPLSKTEKHRLFDRLKPFQRPPKK
jgi:hypothetical protein